MTRLATTRYGPMECLDGDSVVSRSLVQYGEWAQLELDLVATLVRPGDIVLDVGAFLGTHTLALATMVGSAGRVHSFEPRAAIRAVLESNVQRNGLVQVLVHACALGAQAKELVLPAIDIKGEANFGGLALESCQDDGQPTETIRIERLDDLGLGRVDFVKIDAEGMEAEVVEGGKALLAACHPVLVAECNDLERGSRAWSACQALGYEVYGVLSPAYNPANLRGEAVNFFGEASEASLVALPPGRAATLAAAVRAQLAPLPTLDDLALLLLHKAQYPVEVLAGGAAAAVLGMDYASPRARGLSDEVTELRTALGAAYARAQAAEIRAEAAEQRADVAVRAAAAADAVVAALQAQAQQQASAQSHSGLRRWLRRLAKATP